MLMGERQLLTETNLLASALHPLREEYRGKELARKLYGNIPIIYASDSREHSADLLMTSTDAPASTKHTTTAHPPRRPVPEDPV